MTCELCSGGEQMLADWVDDGDGACIALEWKDGKPVLRAEGYYDGGYLAGVAVANIDYCPRCGRKLTEKEKGKNKENEKERLDFPNSSSRQEAIKNYPQVWNIREGAWETVFPHQVRRGRVTGEIK